MELIESVKKKENDVKEVKDLIIMIKNKMENSVSANKIEFTTIFEKIQIEELQNAISEEYYPKMRALLSQYIY